MAWTKLMSPLSERRRFLKTFVVLLLGLGGCLYVRRKDVNIRNYIGKSDSTHSFEEDWFERNITMFQNKANAFEYIVLRKTTIDHYGDFSCHRSKVLDGSVRSRSNRFLKQYRFVMHTPMFVWDLF